MQHRVSDAQPFGEEILELSEHIENQLGELKRASGSESVRAVCSFVSSRSMSQMIKKDWQPEEDNATIVDLVESIFEYGSSLGLPPAAITIVFKRIVTQEQ